VVKRKGQTMEISLNNSKLGDFFYPIYLIEFETNKEYHRFSLVCVIPWLTQWSTNHYT